MNRAGVSRVNRTLPQAHRYATPLVMTDQVISERASPLKPCGGIHGHLLIQRILSWLKFHLCLASEPLRACKDAQARGELKSAAKMQTESGNANKGGMTRNVAVSGGEAHLGHCC